MRSPACLLFSLCSHPFYLLPLVTFIPFECLTCVSFEWSMAHSYLKKDVVIHKLCGFDTLLISFTCSEKGYPLAVIRDLFYLLCSYILFYNMIPCWKI